MWVFASEVSADYYMSFGSSQPGMNPTNCYKGSGHSNHLSMFRNSYKVTSIAVVGTDLRIIACDFPSLETSALLIHG